jgi:hypothetical protein
MFLKESLQEQIKIQRQPDHGCAQARGVWSIPILVASIEEVQNYVTHWMWSYNHDRPNMASREFTPKQRLAMAA